MHTNMKCALTQPFVVKYTLFHVVVNFFCPNNKIVFVFFHLPASS